MPSARTGRAWRRARRGRLSRAAVRRGRRHQGRGTPTRRRAAPAGGRQPRPRADEPSSSRGRQPPRWRPADRADWRGWSRQVGPVPSPDPSAGTVFRVRGVRVADDDAVFRRVDVDVPCVVAFVAVDATATVGFGAAGLAAAGFAAAGFAAAGFARALDRAGEAARDEAGAVDRPCAGCGPEFLDLGRQLGNLGACFGRLLLPLCLDVAGLLEALLEPRQFLCLRPWPRSWRPAVPAD